MRKQQSLWWEYLDFFNCLDKHCLRVNWFEDRQADRLAFKFLVRDVIEIEEWGSEVPRVEITAHRLVAVLKGAHDTRREVYNVTKHGELFARASSADDTTEYLA